MGADSKNRAAERLSGIIALAGRPNVGKSTLLNTILGQKISIVSAREQTTRQQVLGILSRDNVQAVFIDTPGMIRPADRLQEYMTRASFRAVSGADLAVVLVEATGRDMLADRDILDRLAGIDLPRILAINKIDLVGKPALLPLMADYDSTGLFEAIVPLSALTGDGIESLMDEIVRLLPESEFLYDPEQLATQPMRFFAAELVRETLYELLHDELPYASTVAVDEYKERNSGKIYIRAVIYVERGSQKKIVIGSGGRMLREIGKASRLKIEEFTGREVYLDLWVKVMEKWRRNDTFLTSEGFGPGNLKA